MYKTKYYFGLFLLISFLLLFSLNIKAQENQFVGPVRYNFLNYNKNILVALRSQKIDKNKISILIEKSKFRLTVFYKNKAVKSYPIVLGANPVDDKISDGDGCTPEGTFKIKSYFRHQHWSKFLWLNYPTIKSWQKYTKAKVKGTLGVRDSIGGKIGIQGVPNNSDYLIDKRVNWTNGSVSLKNNDIDELYGVIKTGTIVQIIH